MKILLVGGTGTISTAVTRRLAELGEEVYLFNRGSKKEPFPGNVRSIRGDINDEEAAKGLLVGRSFDAVCEFIGFTRPQVERDYRLFSGKTKQYVYISSASAYQKPMRDYMVTEGTALANPFWAYSRNKRACEEYLMQRYQEDEFPVTIVRPSHTYGEKSVPVGLHGDHGSFQVIERMLSGKPVLIHGDGTSLWTMTDSRDFAKGFVGLLGNPHAIGEAFQITSDETLTWNMVYQTIADALGVELHVCHAASEFLASLGGYDLAGTLLGDKANSVVFDNRKLKRAVPEFVPSISFAEGVRHTLDYVLSHKECQVLDPEFDAWCDRVVRVLEDARKEFRQWGSVTE